MISNTTCLSQPSHTIVVTSSNVIDLLCGVINIIIQVHMHDI